jgi:hypothetical protein
MGVDVMSHHERRKSANAAGRGAGELRCSPYGSRVTSLSAVLIKLGKQGHSNGCGFWTADDRT